MQLPNREKISNRVRRRRIEHISLETIPISLETIPISLETIPIHPYILDNQWKEIQIDDAQWKEIKRTIKL